STPSALCSRARATSSSTLPGRTSVSCSDPESGGCGSESAAAWASLRLPASARVCLRESLRPRMSPAGGSAWKSGTLSSWIRPQETRTAQYRLTQPSQSRTVVAIGHFRASEVSDRDHCSAPVYEGDHCSAAGVARRSDRWVVRQRLGGDEGGGHGLVPLVLLRAFESGPVESLLFGVAGEHAEAHGLARVDGDSVESVGGGLAAIVEVRGAAADDDTEGDDRVEVRGQPGRGDGQFEAARHTDERGVGSGLGGGALGSVDQAVHDLRVPGGGDDG